MQRQFTLASNPNVTVTLFNDKEDGQEVIKRIGNGSKKNEQRIHEDIMQARIDSQIKEGKCRLIPV